MNKSFYLEPVAVSILIFCFVVLYIVFRRRFRVFTHSAELTIPSVIAIGGAVEIPLLESYSGIRGWSLFAISDNNLYPRLTLHDHWMEYRVLATRSADYSVIESVRGVKFLFLHIARFTFRDRSLTFSARLANAETLAKLLDFFRKNSVEVR
ncbi:hypothetical protein [Pelolinea submarina]|uniref:Uncharacterized protein n=1 Tax=Pelolinea submarina TaxID=913107 RepID=A0A347ZNU2_9CHLR|nr:hypothetical protein [Pelolinea submarina]REG08576.1 hypothetical protein DFR64_1948 [Pelolinea submarina]BBB46973.1 hypothetical protein Pelsub_P0200 [Pelolinea submarina]